MIHLIITGSLSCGWYQLKYEYWVDCGQPGGGWKECSNNKKCAEGCVRQYMTRYGKLFDLFFLSSFSALLLSKTLFFRSLKAASAPWVTRAPIWLAFTTVVRTAAARTPPNTMAGWSRDAWDASHPMTRLTHFKFQHDEQCRGKGRKKSMKISCYIIFYY